MDEEKKKYICRVCLVPVKNKSLSLFDELRDCFISDHINTITNANISQGDGLPDRICPDCLLELETAVNFKQKCEHSNVILRSTLMPPRLLEKTYKDVRVKEEGEDSEYLEDINFADVDYDTDELETKPLNLLCGSEGTLRSSDQPVINAVTGKKSKAIDLHLQCDDCGGFFKSKCKLRVHWKRHHLPQALICKTCKRTFKSAKAFQRHENVKSLSCTNATNFHIEGLGKDRRFFCKECKYNSHRMKDMITHWVTHTGDRPYECEICGKTCTQQSSLQAHKESAHKQYKVEHTCHFCGKVLKGRNGLYRHLRIHKEKSLPCPICKKLFKSKASLGVHIQRHTGIKSYTCEKCARSFVSSAELCNHRRTVHDKGKYWYYCDVCEYKSVRNEIIKRHKAKHTGSNVPCTVCGRFFENTQKLFLHQRRHFEEKKYQCPQCETRFFRRDSVSKHVRKKHRFTPIPIEKQVTVKQEVPQQYEAVAISPESIPETKNIEKL